MMQRKYFPKVVRWIGTVAIAAAPIAIIMAATGDSEFADVEASSASFITKPKNIRDIEKMIEKSKNKLDVKGWQSTYVKRDWENILDGKMEFMYARKYGWRNLASYETYLRYKYEMFYGKINNEFGQFNKDNSNWIAWHKKAGMELEKSYLDGTSSPTRPTWAGAENVASNNIDNNKKWYAYDQGSFFFVFNDANYHNAWKRLLHINRLVPVSYAALLNQATSNDDKRNYFMVDGKLVARSALNKFTNYFFVTTDGDRDYVVDERGWRVVVTDQNLSKILSKVINPADKLNPAVFFEDQQQGNANINPLVKINYPTDYVVNDNYTISPLNKTRRGKYLITYEYQSFTDLLADNLLILPQEFFPNLTVPWDKYGADFSNTPFSHNWAGGGYMFMWVEDGKGGHKIWKSLHKLEEKVLEANNDEFLMYGNWHHVFPANGKSWFDNIPEIYNDSGV